MIPYGRQSIADDDVAAVVEALRSPHLTQGPRVKEFEEALSAYCGARYAVVVSSGTAALHAAYAAAGLGPGDEFITTAMTFVATANVGVWQGARPVFVDIDPATGNLNPSEIEAKINDKTKAIVPVDYTGRPADIEAINAIAKSHNLIVIEDGAQSLGGVLNGKRVGALADLTTLSFHPVKLITTGEGGAILTDNEKYYKILKRFITHGVRYEDFIETKPGDWYFEMTDLGLNYRLSDLQCALGLSQLKKLDRFLEKRRALVRRYNEAFALIKELIIPPADDERVQSAWHLYTIRLRTDLIPTKREIFSALRSRGVGVQVHHVPVHMHPYYRTHGYADVSLPETEKWYEAVMSLPLFPDLGEKEQQQVINTVLAVISR